jgi:hypothetical protein
VLRGRVSPTGMDNEIVRKLLWTGLVAGAGALASVLANRLAAAVYVRITGEEPPE